MSDNGRPMRFGIAPDVFAVAPTFCVGLVVAEDVANDGPAPASAEELARASGEARRRLADRPPETDPSLAIWRDAFRQAGFNPEQHPSAVEALARRVASGEAVPAINPAVNLANAASLRYLVPVGAHDLDRLRGDFGVRVSRAGDTFTQLGQSGSETVPAGEIIYADALAVRTRRWTWRLGEPGKVTSASRTILFPVDGFVGATDHAVRQAVEDLASSVERVLGARVQTYFVNRDHPSVDLPVPFRPSTDPIDRILNRGISEIIPRDELERRLRSGSKIRIYLGVDPTAPIIHLGHAVALRKLRQLQDQGNQIVFLIGDFTGRIGDPTDKSAARVQLSEADVIENARSYVEQASRILDFSSPTNPVEVRYNGEWWDRMTSRDMIELAANVTAQQMLQRDMFQRRLAENKPIGLHEFLYPLLQGYDSVALEVDAEIGGTDQTFNMLVGRTLLRVLRDREKYVFVTPLLEGTDGRKMSKSFGNVIGITEPPYQMYGKIMSLNDALIARYFELLTDLPEAEIVAMGEAMATGGANPMEFKKRLAFDLVNAFHSPDAAQDAAERFAREIQRKEQPAEIPSVPLDRGGPWPIGDLLVALGLAISKSEARRLVEQGSISIDDQRVVDPRATIEVRSGLVVRGRRRLFVRIVID